MEITTMALIVLIAAAVAYVPVGHYLQDTFYADTHEIVRWQVYKHYGERSKRESYTIGPEVITPTNYWSAKNLAKDISGEVSNSNASAILRCIYSRWSECDGITIYAQGDTVRIDKPAGMPSLAAEYVTTALKYDKHAPIYFMTVAPGGWTVKLNQHQS